MDMKNLILPISIIVAGLIIAGAVIWTKGPQKELGLPKGEEKIEETKTEITISEKDHLRGNLEAKVSIVEFSDFQCSFCARFHSTVQQILADYPEQVRWVYKHFPLDQIHPQARPAAEASECAAEQEKFWEFADLLVENQERLGEALFKELAVQIGLNLDQFNNCFSSRKYKDQVEADLQEGVKAGVRGTPASFINGELISGAVPYETLKAAVGRALGNL